MTDARLTAERLVALMRERAPELLQADGVDLGSALEQHLFLRLSAPPDEARGESSIAAKRLASLVSVAAAIQRWALGRRFLNAPSSARRGSGIVVLHAAIHAKIWAPVAKSLADRGYAPLVLVRGSPFPEANAARRSPNLVAFIGARQAIRLLARQARQVARMRYATVGWSREIAPSEARALRVSAGRALTRLVIQRQQLAAMIERVQPSLLIAFSELSEWARVAAAVGREYTVPTLDLPHAETSNPETLVGIDYDRMAVFGPHAAAVARAAGIPSDRVVAIGAPHFDRLVSSPPREPSEPRKIVFASQHTVGLMTSRVKRETLEAAVAVAAAVAPTELLVKLHPVEREHRPDKLVPSPLPPGVTLRVVEGGSLTELLDGAWLLVTGWSNSVFEATLMGVPSLTINLTGRDEPMGFAAEGMSLGATDSASAAAAAQRLLDADWRNEVVARARDLLEEHLGPLDGRASERAADLIVEMAGDRLPRLAR